MTPSTLRRTLRITAAPWILMIAACSRPGGSMDHDRLRAFATDYATAWSSRNAASVASHFAPNGSLTINDGTPSVGRTAITSAAQDFMTAFPDMVVTMDSLRADSSGTVFHWTLAGTNTGPGGTGKSVRFSGFEEWTIGDDGLIHKSLGHFDRAEYERQLRDGVSRSH